MIKALHIINGLAIGGAEMNLVRLLGSMDRRRFENSVVSLRRIDSLTPRLRGLGIRTEMLDMRGLATAITSMPKLIGLIQEVRPHVVHTSMYHASLLGLLANRLAGNAPLIWSIHSSEQDFSTYSSGLKPVFRLLSRLASIPDAVVFNSYVSHQWHQQIGFKFRRWQLIPNGVDTHAFCPDSKARACLRSELGLTEDDLILGTVGRFHPQKDYPTFLRAFAKLCRTVRNAHAVIVGSGLTPANRELAQLAELLGIDNRLHMLGPRSDIQSIVGGFDLFVLASAFAETCPTVLIEAMACGVPCVATDVGDSARIIGDTGKIVPVRNASALAAACAEVLSTRCASSPASARQRIQERYSIEIMTKGFADLFEDLVNRRTQAAFDPDLMEPADLAMDANSTRLPRMKTSEPCVRRDR